MTDQFPVFSKSVHDRFTALSEGELFKVDVGDIFASYLAAFPEGTNPIFRERTEHDCNCCKNFIRNLGTVVSIRDDNTIATVWDNWQDLPEPYATVGQRLQQLVQQAPIVGIFRTTEAQYGHEKNRDNHDLSIVWHHFYGRTSRKHQSRTPAKDIGRISTMRGVFKRGLEELSVSDLETVMDLINDGSLYRGAEHKNAVREFIAIQRKWLEAADREAFIWANVRNPAAGFRNTVIGTLVTDLSKGVDLEDAVRMFESKVAPQNYKRSKALITPKMVEGAMEKLRDLDLESAVERRHAKLSDVSVNDVLWVNRDAASQMKDGIEGMLLGEAAKQAPAKIDPDKAQKIRMDDFLANIVPNATSIDLLLQGRHLGNFMSITAPAREDTGRLFQWDNDFAWSYDGDVTDSIKERVKAAGGNVKAELRVSLAWTNRDDLDIHCYGPEGHIYYVNKANILDVDMNVSWPVRDAVENLAWQHPRNGRYDIRVNNYTRRDTHDQGYTIELATPEGVTQFHSSSNPGGSRTHNVLAFDYNNGRIERLEVGHHMSASGGQGVEKWGLTTGQLVPVATLMKSPNHWGDNEKGNLHWFFILEGCKNPDAVRGIYNEYLRGELTEHRKVFEVLGAKAKCPPAEEQLSGVGFSSTKKESAIFVVNNRAYNVEF